MSKEPIVLKNGLSYSYRSAQIDGRVLHMIADRAAPMLRGIEALRCFTEIGHGISKQSGWYNDPKTGNPIPRNMGEVIALIHSEADECYDGVVTREIDAKLPQHLNSVVELADIAIRIFDTLGANNFVNEHVLSLASGKYAGRIVPLHHRTSLEHGALIFLNAIHNALSQALEAHRKGRAYDLGAWLIVALLHTFHFADSDYAVNLAEIIFDKMTYNLNREDHKLENRARAGGKAY